MYCFINQINSKPSEIKGEMYDLLISCKLIMNYIFHKFFKHSKYICI